MIVFAADLHLRPTTWAKFPELKGDAFYSFRQLVDYCCNEKAQALILGGDVFDTSTPDSDSVMTFKLGMEMLEASNVPVFGIQGQHERADPPWMALNPHVKYLDDPSMAEFRTWPLACDGHTLTVRGIDNTSATALKRILEYDVEKGALGERYDILVMHQAMQGLVYAKAWNLAEEWVPDFVHIVLLGDLHIEASKGKCHYSGSMILQSVDESPQKSFITLHCDEDGKLSVQRQKLETRDMMKFTITDEESRDAAIDILTAYKPNKGSSEILRPLVVAHVSSDVSSAYAHLEAVCETGNMFLDVRDLRLASSESAAEAVRVEASPMEDLVEESVEPMKFDNPDDKQELTNFAVRLLKSKNPSAELTSIKQEMGVTTGAG